MITYIFQNIRPHMEHLDIAVTNKALIPKIKPMLNRKTKFYCYPFCFPDGLIMFRNAAWKYPLKKSRPLNNTPAETVRVNPCQFYTIFSRNLSFLSKFALYSPQNAYTLFIFSGNSDIRIELSEKQVCCGNISTNQQNSSTILPYQLWR